jgi:O-acetyl-ADP-ribose deacetylase (regulator of RNase III)
MPLMDLEIVHGDLLKQDVDCIVNAWNRNIFPWWLLVPQGVWKAIRREAGLGPFKELRQHGVLPLGAVVLTGPGKLRFRGLIHVAGIGLDWRASEKSIRLSVRNALRLASESGFRSVAFPLIGAGTGGAGQERSLRFMRDELATSEYPGLVKIVVFATKPS